jgi:Bifunctional DNA primase/polymerase, N-terminal
MRAITLDGRLLPIVPCRDKAPICPGGFNAATTDPVAIAVLWQRCYSGTQVGVATGSVSGIDVLDVDPRKGGDRWYHQHRTEIPTTRMHETPSGGWHLIFRHSPGLRCSQGVIARGIDVKADGGGVVWHPKSALRVLCEGPVAAWPQWLLDLAGNSSSAAFSLAAAGGELTGSSPTPVTSQGMAAELPAYSREGGGPLVARAERRLPKPLYYKLVRLMPVGGNVTAHDQRRARGALSMLIEKCAGEGRNAALNWSAFVVFRELIASGVVTRAAAESLLLDAATLNGYVAKDGEAATRRTIQSGLGADPNTGGPSPLFDEGAGIKEMTDE